MFEWFKSPKLVERAEAAAKQMRYFRVFSQRGEFRELVPSALRGGFIVVGQGQRDVSFRWGTTPESETDFLFNVSFENPDRAAVIAEACRDLSGLVLVSHSNLPNISVEMKPAPSEQGSHALEFRKLLLKFPDFDGGVEDILARFAR